MNVTQDLFITKEFIKYKALPFVLKRFFPQSCLLGEVFVIIPCKVHSSVILKRSVIKGKLALSTSVNDGYCAVTTRKTYFSYENIGWRQRNKTIHLPISISTKANFSVSFHSSPLFSHIKLKWFLDFLESIFYFKLWVLDFLSYSCCWCCRIKVHIDMMSHCCRHASVFHGGIHGWLNISKSIISGS